MLCYVREIQRDTLAVRLYKYLYHFYARKPWKMMDHSRYYVIEKGVLELGG
jgi:hypothetical protein